MDLPPLRMTWQHRMNRPAAKASAHGPNQRGAPIDGPSTVPPSGSASSDSRRYRRQFLVESKMPELRPRPRVIVWRYAARRHR
jgi:hypothetical protein